MVTTIQPGLASPHDPLRRRRNDNHEPPEIWSLISTTPSWTLVSPTPPSSTFESIEGTTSSSVGPRSPKDMPHISPTLSTTSQDMPDITSTLSATSQDMPVPSSASLSSRDASDSSTDAQPWTIQSTLAISSSFQTIIIPTGIVSELVTPRTVIDQTTIYSTRPSETPAAVATQFKVDSSTVRDGRDSNKGNQPSSSAWSFSLSYADSATSTPGISAPGVIGAATLSNSGVFTKTTFPYAPSQTTNGTAPVNHSPGSDAVDHSWKMGIAIGVSIGCALFLVTLAAFILRRLRQRKDRMRQPRHGAQDSSSTLVKKEVELNMQPLRPVELSRVPSGAPQIPANPTYDFNNPGAETVIGWANDTELEAALRSAATRRSQSSSSTYTSARSLKSQASFASDVFSLSEDPTIHVAQAVRIQRPLRVASRVAAPNLRIAIQQTKQMGSKRNSGTSAYFTAPSQPDLASRRPSNQDSAQ